MAFLPSGGQDDTPSGGIGYCPWCSVQIVGVYLLTYQSVKVASIGISGQRPKNLNASLLHPKSPKKATKIYRWQRVDRSHIRQTGQQPVQSTQHSCWVVPTARTLSYWLLVLFFIHISFSEHFFQSDLYIQHIFLYQIPLRKSVRNY